MTDADKAVEAADRVFERLTRTNAIGLKNYSALNWHDDAKLALDFCRQVQRERAAMPAKLERLRDDFAGQIFAAMLVDPAVTGMYAEIAERAYGAADAMLEARKPKP